MQMPEWLKEVREEFCAEGAWASTLNILDNEGEEFEVDSDMAIADHIAANLRELTGESQDAADRATQACAWHLSQTIGTKTIEAAAAHGDNEGNEAEIADLRSLLGLALEALSLEQWRALLANEDVKRVLATVTDE